ncbi:MAG TPA: fimbria/pilus periplasmic chaperone [Allosphingosinicella sp.]|jgi:fimbrial chaperone protein
MTLLIRKGGRRIAAALSAALALLAGAAPAAAANVRVNPVNVVLAPNRGSAELRVTNTDKQIVSMRVSAVRWTQEGGRDVYTPAPEVIASPPIFSVAVGGTQVIRLGLRSRTAGAAYRIRLEEIPSASTDKAAIRVALKLDLPFYVLASAHAKPALQGLLEPAGVGQTATIRNDGNRHARVLRVKLVDGAGRTLAASAAAGVVLPHSARSFRLAPVETGTPAALIVTTAEGKVRSQLGAPRP